jgi:hypothetical protein
MKYRKKTVIIEVVQWTGENFDEIGEILSGVQSYFEFKQGYSTVKIETDTQILFVNKNDYIIRCDGDRYFVFKPDEFKNRYEPIICNDFGGVATHETV